MLIETYQDREGHHLFCYPFAGRLVHEGLASLVAFHAGQHQPDSFSTACNDYGFEVLARQPTDWAEILTLAFDPEALGSSLLQAMNLGELSRREFREVARIAGLVFEGYPGARKSNRQLQTSSGLLYDVFMQYDPDNLLMQQARNQVLQRQFERSRLTRTHLKSCSKSLGIGRVWIRPHPLPCHSCWSVSPISSAVKTSRPVLPG